MNNYYIDRKYIGLLSSRFRNFKKKSEDLYNLSCPYCGDSTSHKLKARGYIFRRGDDFFYYCHKCHKSRKLSNFFKDQAPDLYNQYCFELFGNNNIPEEIDNFPLLKPPYEVDSVCKIFLDNTYSMGLFEHHQKLPVGKYLLRRMIPLVHWDNLYYTDNFKKLVEFFDPKKAENLREYEEYPRVIIPFVNRDNELVGFSGRYIGEDKKVLRYITVSIDDNSPKIWNLNKVDITKRIYLTEGSFDGMFLSNPIAANGSGLHSIIQDTPNIFGTMQLLDIVAIFDNQRRNKQIIANMKKVLDVGGQLFVPRIMLSKDINEAVIAGAEASSIEKQINGCTYSGLQGYLELDKWSKI